MNNRKKYEQRAKELVAQMTIEERASQLRYDAPPIRRLNIPAYNWWNEALHGVARAGTATVFPQAIGLAAMFDDEFLKKIADVIATEGRAKYNAYSKNEDRDIYKGLTFWSPNVNIFRDPRWGRGQETYGEDPYLSSRLGVAFIKGLQGDGEHLKLAACAKHFAVHSGPESLRHEFDAIASLKDMEETYLPAFEACVKEAQVESVMGAYNRTNGEPCCGSDTLLRKVLREKWGFKGHIVSDCWALKDFHTHHGVTSTAVESAAMAIKAGCDLNCGNTYLHILQAYQEGLVTEEQITRATERLFTTRFMLGVFDQTEYDEIPYEVVECKSHLEMAEEAARKSCVLLKNDGILPLQKKNIKTIGVIGPNANSRDALIGNYHGTASRYETILQGIQDEVGEEIRVLYSEGSHLFKERVEPLGYANDRVKEAIIVAQHSDVVILCLGLDEHIEGEEFHQSNEFGSGDKIDLLLPKSQRVLMEEIAKVGKPVILCVMAGSALDLSFAEEYFSGILLAWYPGARGGKAVADLLFGKLSPSGKLPITFYRSLEKLPDFEDYSMKGRTYRYMTTDAFYPFGYGLTYSDVRCKQVEIEEKEEVVHIQVQVTNEGVYAVEEVIQIYVKDEESIWAPPNPILCGFKRISLHPGEKKFVEINVEKQSLTVVDERGNRFIDGAGFVFYVGISQPDVRSIQLTGKKPVQCRITLKK